MKHVWQLVKHLPLVEGYHDVVLVTVSKQSPRYVTLHEGCICVDRLLRDQLRVEETHWSSRLPDLLDHVSIHKERVMTFICIT